MAANLGFSFLSMFHLAYLGIMFGGDSEVQEKVTFCLIFYLWNITLDGLNYPPPMFSLYFSTAGKGPFVTGKAKTKHQRHTLLAGGGEGILHS